MGRRRKLFNALPSTSIRQKAYLSIQHKIANGELAAGDAISELDLAKELGSSRTPVREAIGQLVAEGLLEQSSGGGILVVQFTRENILDLFELREALETYALSKVARLGLMHPTDRQKLQKYVDGILVLRDELKKSGEPVLSTEQMNRFIALDFNYHAVLMGLSQNARIHKVLVETRLLIRVFAMRTSGHNLEDLERIHQQHSALLDAIQKQDVATTVQIITAHIQASQKERLEAFDQARREASIKKSLPAYLGMYQLLDV